MRFSRLYNLRLDSVYVISDRSKKVPMVSFGSIESEYEVNKIVQGDN